MNARPLMYHDSPAGELHRQQRKVDARESVAAQLEADARNFKLLQGDQRLVRLCRAYFMGDEAQRDRLAGEAEKVMAEVREAACES